MRGHHPGGLISAPNQPSNGFDDAQRGNALFRQYEKGRHLAILNAVIDAYARATQADAAQPDWWRNLAVALLRRFSRTNSLDDCDRAIAALNRAMDSSGADRARRANLAQLLGMSWHARFEETADLPSLDNAIHAYRDARDLDTTSPTPAGI